MLTQILLAGLSVLRANRRPAMPWPLLLTAAALAILAAGFLTLAVYLALLPSLGAPMAALLMSSGLAFLASVLVVVAMLLRRSAATNSAEPLMDPVVLAEAFLKARDSKDSTPTMLVLLAAGLALGYSPSLRRTLRDAVRQFVEKEK